MRRTIPETPEAVALFLFCHVVKMTAPNGNAPTVCRALDLYAECLRAVNGERKLLSEATH